MGNKTPGTKKIHPQLKIFGKNIRYLREARNLSLEALSSKTNMSVKVLTDMENRVEFEAKFLVFLCNFYSVSPSKLFSKTFTEDTKSLLRE